MKSGRYWLALLLALAAGSAAGQNVPDLTADREAVRAAAEAYMDGELAGMADRVEEVIHQEFSKAGVSVMQPTGRHFLRRMGMTMQVEAVRARGELAAEDERGIDIEVLGIGHDIATVRAVSATTHEYLQLAKIDGKWQLINALWVPAGIDPGAGNGSEADLVEATALNYIDGAYSGNADRMTRALARDFHKVVPLRVPTTGRTLLRHASASVLIEATAAQRMNLPADERAIDLTVEDVNRGIASVWIVSAMYIDLLQIAKINDEWKIVNVLWVPNPDAPGRGG